MAEYRNMLEPPSLMAAFVAHPPEGFVINAIPSATQNIYSFFADLDLFTTLEDNAKKIVTRLRQFSPITRVIKQWLTPNVLFIGAPVSEYCWLPNSLDLDAFKQAIMMAFKQAKRQFLIIKDIPNNSPFLGANDNQKAADLVAYLKANGFLILSGQALAYLPINFSSIDEYLQRFSASRKKDFRRKMKIGQTLEVREINTGDAFFSDSMVYELYALYLNMYHKSDIHFDKLTLGFFKQILQQTTDGKVFLYRHHDTLIGFNLCYVMGDSLVDKYAGALYPHAFDAALFFNTSFANIRYCLTHSLKTYIMGWTEPKTKAVLGCRFTYTTHAVYIKNPILRCVLSQFQSRFEGDRHMLENTEMLHA